MSISLIGHCELLTNARPVYSTALFANMLMLHKYLQIMLLRDATGGN